MEGAMDTMMIGADYGMGMMITFQESEVATKTLIYIIYVSIYICTYIYIRIIIYYFNKT